MANSSQTRMLTRRRIWLAFATAIAADGLQIALGPIGWAFLDEILDVMAMITTSLLLGFHPLLLPTFIIELVPGVDMFPTWIGCVAAVVLLRKQQQRPPPPSPADAPSSKVIDI